MIYYDPYHPETNAKSPEEWLVASSEASSKGFFAYCVSTCSDEEWPVVAKSLGLELK